MLSASIVGVLGDILGILILAIVAVAIFFVVQLLRPDKKASRLEEERQRPATKSKRDAA
jgi:hypothetical protein